MSRAVPLPSLTLHGLLWGELYLDLWAKFGRGDLCMMSFSNLEFRASRYSDGRAVLTGLNNSLPHFLHFSSDLDKIYALSLSSCECHENRRRERLTSPIRVEYFPHLCPIRVKLGTGGIYKTELDD
jgi:hypothetical protein